MAGCQENSLKNDEKQWRNKVRHIDLHLSKDANLYIKKQITELKKSNQEYKFRFVQQSKEITGLKAAILKLQEALECNDIKFAKK